MIVAPEFNSQTSYIIVDDDKLPASSLTVALVDQNALQNGLNITPAKHQHADISI